MANRNKSNRISRRWASAVGLVLMLCYLLVMPSVLFPRLGINQYKEWLSPSIEPHSGILSVWHIVSFKPSTGSLGAWLKSRAKEYSKDLVGIYFEVETYTVSEAEERMASGREPDILSFANGTHSAQGLLTINGEYQYDISSGTYGGALIAVPYCASGNLLLYKSGLHGSTEEELLQRAGTVEDFKKGRADACIADARATGDMYRAWLDGSGEAFEAMPIKGENSLVQYLAITTSVEPELNRYAQGFIEYIGSSKVQSKLTSLGLIPMNKSAECKYETEWNAALADAFDMALIPNSFDRYYSGSAS